MAIERRVKPSTRIKEALQAKWKPVLLILFGIVVLTGLIVGSIVISKLHLFQPRVKTDLPTDVIATRTILTQRVSYEGIWVGEINDLFEVYLPGKELDTSKQYQSMAVTAERYEASGLSDSYGNSIVAAYGVYTGSTPIDIAVSADPFYVWDAVSASVIDDMAMVCTMANPSGAYDMEILFSDSGEQMLRVSGNVQMSALVQVGTDVQVQTFEHPIIVYVVLKDSYPVCVWCIYDFVDTSLSETIPPQMEEVMSTLWQSKSPSLDTRNDDLEGTPSDFGSSILPNTVP